MKTKTITLYGFNELSDKAKERARNWWLEGLTDFQWYELTVEHWQGVCEAFGVNDPAIAFRGFWSQGDGASFTGIFHPESVAESLADVCRDDAVIALHARLRALQHPEDYSAKVYLSSGMYVFSGMMECEDRETGGNGQHERELRAIFRALADIIYRDLEEEYNHISSDESVDEVIIGSDYYFHESGEPE